MKKTKQNKYAHLSKPEAELDFHGMGILTENQVQSITDDFIKKSKQNKLKKVLIITGKGLHSRNEVAVVKPIVIAFLKRHEDVESCMEARRDRGGSGALEVTLN